MNDAHHPFNLLGRNGTCPALFSEEVHYMCGKFITCLWRKKRLRHGFVPTHKDTSSDLAVGGRQHWGWGTLTWPCPLHTRVATGSHTACPGDLQPSWGSQGSQVTTALLPPCSSLCPRPCPQPDPSGEEQSDQPLYQLQAGAGCEWGPTHLTAGWAMPGQGSPKPCAWVPPCSTEEPESFLRHRVSPQRVISVTLCPSLARAV